LSCHARFAASTPRFIASQHYLPDIFRDYAITLRRRHWRWSVAEPSHACLRLFVIDAAAASSNIYFLRLCRAADSRAAAFV